VRGFVSEKGSLPNYEKKPSGVNILKRRFRSNSTDKAVIIPTSSAGGERASIGRRERLPLFRGEGGVLVRNAGEAHAVPILFG